MVTALPIFEVINTNYIRGSGKGSRTWQSVNALSNRDQTTAVKATTANSFFTPQIAYERFGLNKNVFSSAIEIEDFDQFIQSVKASRYKHNQNKSFQFQKQVIFSYDVEDILDKLSETKISKYKNPSPSKGIDLITAKKYAISTYNRIKNSKGLGSINNINILVG